MLYATKVQFFNLFGKRTPVLNSASWQHLIQSLSEIVSRRLYYDRQQNLTVYQAGVLHDLDISPETIRDNSYLTQVEYEMTSLRSAQ